jgi:hypothetical protein
MLISEFIREGRALFAQCDQIIKKQTGRFFRDGTLSCRLTENDLSNREKRP